jgi:hypothetical protein
MSWNKDQFDSLVPGDIIHISTYNRIIPAVFLRSREASPTYYGKSCTHYELWAAFYEDSGKRLYVYIDDRIKDIEQGQYPKSYINSRAEERIMKTSLSSLSPGDKLIAKALQKQLNYEHKDH